jgi:16S rRNA (uracil1498-N3)-methyltransferase
MIRLFVSSPLAAGTAIPLDDKQSHYLLHVMRVKAGDAVLVFNGRDGEWRGLVEATKKAAHIKVEAQTRPQTTEPDLWLLFAPIKRGHGDFTVEKASELGVSRIIPIKTRRTVVGRVPIDRYRAIATEAAEQCERLSTPEIAEDVDLPKILENWDPNRTLILCAEAGDAQNVTKAVSSIPPGPLAVMIGPEGGFADEEFALLRSKKFVVPVRLGPRILRADTAAISALALIQALKGDWTD